ncbi:hypothetical protein SAMN04487913_103234 [Arthrobacter sp. ok362]|nr:hypothetical protein SAMN04487913_103234 [Arthrobacter sp. ok362]
MCSLKCGTHSRSCLGSGTLRFGSLEGWVTAGPGPFVLDDRSVCEFYVDCHFSGH